jgi:ribonuclease HII
MNSQLLISYSGLIEAGCDEAGRGPLAGPVYAAAVIMPQGWNHPLLNDSKRVKEKDRELLRDIIEREAIAWGVASCSPEEIDQINILRASITAMHRSLDLLKVRPQFIIVDGNRFYDYSPNRNNDELLHQFIPHKTIVKGDAKYISIAAASILAKSHRDQYMREAAIIYPGYGFEKHMGYPTAAHYEAIKLLGPTPIHRKSFKLFKP